MDLKLTAEKNSSHKVSNPIASPTSMKPSNAAEEIDYLNEVLKEIENKSLDSIPSIENIESTDIDNVSIYLGLPDRNANISNSLSTNTYSNTFIDSIDCDIVDSSDKNNSVHTAVKTFDKTLIEIDDNCQLPESVVQVNQCNSFLDKSISDINLDTSFLLENFEDIRGKKLLQIPPPPSLSTVDLSLVKVEPLEDLSDKFDLGNFLDPAEDFPIKEEVIQPSEVIFSMDNSTEEVVAVKPEPQNVPLQTPSSAYEVRFRVDENITLYSREQLHAAKLISQSTLAAVVDMDMFNHVAKSMPQVSLVPLDYHAKNLRLLAAEDHDLVEKFCLKFGNDPVNWKILFKHKSTSRKKSHRSQYKKQSRDSEHLNDKSKKKMHKIFCHNDRFPDKQNETSNFSTDGELVFLPDIKYSKLSQSPKNKGISSKSPKKSAHVRTKKNAYGKSSKSKFISQEFLSDSDSNSEQEKSQHELQKKETCTKMSKSKCISKSESVSTEKKSECELEKNVIHHKYSEQKSVSNSFMSDSFSSGCVDNKSENPCIETEQQNSLKSSTQLAPCKITTKLDIDGHQINSSFEGFNYKCPDKFQKLLMKCKILKIQLSPLYPEELNNFNPIIHPLSPAQSDDSNEMTIGMSLECDDFQSDGTSMSDDELKNTGTSVPGFLLNSKTDLDASKNIRSDSISVINKKIKTNSKFELIKKISEESSFENCHEQSSSGKNFHLNENDFTNISDEYIALTEKVVTDGMEEKLKKAHMEKSKSNNKNELSTTTEINSKPKIESSQIVTLKNYICKDSIIATDQLTNLKPIVATNLKTFSTNETNQKVISLLNVNSCVESKQNEPTTYIEHPFSKVKLISDISCDVSAATNNFESALPVAKSDKPLTVDQMRLLKKYLICQCSVKLRDVSKRKRYQKLVAKQLKYIAKIPSTEMTTTHNEKTVLPTNEAIVDSKFSNYMVKKAYEKISPQINRKQYPGEKMQENCVIKSVTNHKLLPQIQRKRYPDDKVQESRAIHEIKKRKIESINKIKAEHGKHEERVNSNNKKEHQVKVVTEELPMTTNQCKLTGFK